MVYNISMTSLPEVKMLGRIRQVGYWNYRIHPASDHIFVIVLHGQCVFEIADEKYAVSTGECFFMPQDTLYRVYTEDECEYYFLHFRTSQPVLALEKNAGAARIRETAGQSGGRQVVASPFDMQQTRHDQIYIARKFALAEKLDAALLLLAKCDGARVDPDLNSKLLVDLYFSEILILFSSITLGYLLHEPQFPLILSRMIIHIQRYYTQPITLTSLSEEFHLSKQYIIRLFKTHLHTTVTRFINSLKLRHAQELLKYSRMNINEIASFLGFGSAYYFSRLFRRSFLLTPSEYIRSELEMAGRQTNRPLADH